MDTACLLRSPGMQGSCRNISSPDEQVVCMRGSLYLPCPIIEGAILPSIPPMPVWHAICPLALILIAVGKVSGLAAR